MIHLLTIVLVVLKALGYIHCSWLLALAPSLLVFAFTLAVLVFSLVVMILAAVSK